MSDLPRAALLAIGTELTRGEIVNANGAWLAERLTTLGVDVIALETIADDPAAIVDALERLSARCALVVCTGGLGPTSDDITSETVARWLGVAIERRPEALEHIRSWLARYGRALEASNASQADFPAGATVLRNDRGTAPGFAVERGSCRLFFTPGVPREMKAMFEQSIAPFARTLAGGAEAMIRLRCFGVPESQLNEQLRGLEEQHGVVVGYRAHYPEVQVKILARAAEPTQARARCEAAAAAARERLGAGVYAEGSEDMPALTARLCRSLGATLALAESCTGGLVASLIAAEPASDFLLGGVVSYSNDVKVRQLGVEPEALERHGAVSDAVVRQMAQGARQRLGADCSIAITGIAGPSGGSAEKPVGLVYLGVASAAGTTVRRLDIGNRTRQAVQLYAAWAAMALLCGELRGQGAG